MTAESNDIHHSQPRNGLAKDDGTPLREHAERAVEAVGEKAKQAQDAVKTQLEAGQAQAVRAGDQINGYVRENPAVALAAAAGIGLLIGVALTARR